MSATGYGVDSYQDIASAAMGGYAGMNAPSYQQQGLNLQKQLMWSEYNRNKARQDQKRLTDDFDKQEERAYRALPGQFNQRGMLDSGQYQRGGRELAAALLDRRNRADQDYMQNQMTSHLQDSMGVADLEGLRGQLTGDQYRSLVSALVSGAGGAA